MKKIACITICLLVSSHLALASATDYRDRIASCSKMPKDQVYFESQDHPRDLTCVAKEEKRFENFIYHEKYDIAWKIIAANGLHQLFVQRGDTQNALRILDRRTALEAAAEAQRVIAVGSCNCSVSYSEGKSRLTFSNGTWVEKTGESQESVEAFFDSFPIGFIGGRWIGTPRR